MKNKLFLKHNVIRSIIGIEFLNLELDLEFRSRIFYLSVHDEIYNFVYIFLVGDVCFA